jgi:hypothetical protein
MYLLIPGRHQLLTNFQTQYLTEIINADFSGVTDINGKTIPRAPIEAIIFAVTSANHSNTRRNPLPFYLRALMIERFSRELPVPCFIYGVDDVGNVPNFAEYTVKRIKHESESQFDLKASNTLVICSTPVLEMYEREGFTILPAELQDRKTWKHHVELPWDFVEKIASDKNWKANADIVKGVHPSAIELFSKYKLDEKVQMLFRDKMISSDGDITTTRDYNTYVRQMDDTAVLKYQDTAPYIRPGRVGDIGCAVGSWIKLACNDVRWRESDFYGIEVARQLFDICQQRKHNGEFKNPFVFFSQRNAVTGLVFDKGSMNTIHTSSLTHEIESYGSREDLLAFIKNRFDELAPGGIWINRDVVGPENKEQIVLMKLNKADGRNDDFDKTFTEREKLAEYLKGLSTYGRFLRFKNDFRKQEGYQLKSAETTTDGQLFIRLSLKDACEFMSRKDYIDNWQSEMHETFCFWDFDEWKQHMVDTGFVIASESKAYANEWIIKNRFEGKVQLFTDAVSPQPMNYPITNMLLLGFKP